MKKIVAIMALLVISTLTFAGKPLQVKKGTLDFLKDDAIAKVEMDYSQTTWEKKRPYDQFCGDTYEERVSQSQEAFIQGFNSKSKSLKLTDDDEQVKYTITVHVGDLERKVFDIASFYIRIVGTITVVYNETGEEVCTIEMDKLKGAASYIPNTRLYSCFLTLGQTLAKLKK